ncbi:MAG: GTPase Era, partial [Chitinophagaceae bacterium]|nr:GTPase Era [Chitinophagaceae bacterium]
IEQAKQRTDVILYVADVKDSVEENKELIKQFKIKAPIILALNKCDKSNNHQIEICKKEYDSLKQIKAILPISAIHKSGIDELKQAIAELLPEMPPYYEEDTITDKPMRFFVSELIREKLFFLLKEELPYHAAVMVRQYEEKENLTKIQADIIVSRETQKGIIIGKGGSMIKEIGQSARLDIEKFIEKKVFLELFVKVRKDWRNNDLYLKEYGY